MTEKKMGLVEGVLTDLKIMMDAAPFSYDSGSERRGLNEFEPSPEYLNAISGPFPLKEEEVEEVVQDEDYKNVMEAAVSTKDTPYKSLQIDELPGSNLSVNSAISVTKLSPDLDSMSLKELQTLAKQNGLTVSPGTRRKAIIDMIKGENSGNVVNDLASKIDGPELVGGAPL